VRSLVGCFLSCFLQPFYFFGKSERVSERVSECERLSWIMGCFFSLLFFGLEEEPEVRMNRATGMIEYDAIRYR